MSRPKAEINPIRAERVKTLIDLLDIKQQEFARLSLQSQQNLSRIINMKCSLTEPTAHAIIAAADRIVDERTAAQAGITPEEYGEHATFRIQWLMGYDDNMTYEDEINNTQHLKDLAADGMWAIIEKSLKKQGKSLRFVHRQGQHVDSTQRLKADCYYSIVDRDGNELKRLSAAEMVKFEMQIQEYCDFLTERKL